MNKLLKQILIRIVLKNKRDQDNPAQECTDQELKEAWKIFKINTIRYFKDIILITIGIFSAAFGFKGFLLTNHFIDGGATGISLLISALTIIPLYILLIVVNIPFIIMGYFTIGRTFAIKTALAITGLAFVVATVEFPNITNDNLLVALFGGFFLGAGIGLSIRGGAVIDGTEVLAIYLSKKLGATIGDIIIVINILIFGTAAYFLSVEIALYSMVTYLAASKTLDFVIEGIEEYTGVTIISSYNDLVRNMIIEKLGRGVTVYNGKSGYGKAGEAKDIEIVYTVVTRLELNKLNTELEKIDSNAFVVMSSIKDSKGGMIKKRPLKH
ncbi:MAG TPA: YitT family protein [Saprospiraceae bacterium]|nr:YitT family protein [Saprospiraceae bacterium]